MANLLSLKLKIHRLDTDAEVDSGLVDSQREFIWNECQAYSGSTGGIGSGEVLRQSASVLGTTPNSRCRSLS